MRSVRLDVVITSLQLLRDRDRIGNAAVWLEVSANGLAQTLRTKRRVADADGYVPIEFVFRIVLNVPDVDHAKLKIKLYSNADDGEGPKMQAGTQIRVTTFPRAAAAFVIPLIRVGSWEKAAEMWARGLVTPIWVSPSPSNSHP